MTTESARAVSGGLGCLALAVLAGCNTAPSDTGGGVKAVAAGMLHTCALMNDLTVRCWGQNMSGMLGDGTDAFMRMSPGPVIGLKGVARIFAGYPDSCAQLGDGTITCWGGNQYGQLGDGTTTQRELPTAALGGLALQDLSVGRFHTCGLWPDGTAGCWGDNLSGQLGDGTTSARLMPTQLGLAGVRQVVAGDSVSCAVMVDGTVNCWGGNALGSLGDGTTMDHVTPAPVPGLGGVMQVGLGASTACALLQDGSVQCWGDNRYGQLGNGTVHASASAPATPQPVSLPQVAQLAVGDNFVCALLVSGVVSCWGNNDFGQLGDGTRISRSSAQLVPGLTGVVQISAGSTQTCALTDTGALLCWGDELAYIFANGGGPESNRLTPAPIQF